MLNVYHIDHDGHYIAGMSVVIAENEEQALELLAVELKEHGLDPSKSRVHRKLLIDKPRAYVLHDGDY